VRNFRLLARRNFGLLWAGGLISFIGDWVLFTGMPIFIYRITGSALATTLMFAAGVVPSVLLGSVAGVYVDRWDRRRTIIVGNLMLALVLVPLAFVHDAGTIWIVYLVVFAAATIGQFVNPAVGALLPRLVEKDELVPANSLNASSANLARIVGPPIGGVIAAAAGITGVAIVDAVTFLAPALLVGLMCGVPSTAAAPATVEDGVRAWRKLWRDWAAGLKVIRERRVVSTLFVLVGVSSIGEGVFRVLFILYVVQLLHGGASELGVLMSMQGIGSVIGSFALVAISARVAPAPLIGWTALLFGAIDLVIFNAPGFGATFTVVAALFLLVGLPGAMTFPTMFGVIQASVPDEYRGRVLGAMGTTASLLALVGLGIGGALAAPLGTVLVLNVQGLGYAIAGATMLVLLPRAMDRDRDDPLAIAG
jgi:MFS family permease